MNHRTLVSIGNQYFLLPEFFGDHGAIISALLSATEVERIGWGEEAKYLPKSSSIQISKVPAESCIHDELEVVKTQLSEAQKESKNNSQMFSKYYNKAQELEKELKVLKGVAE